MMLLWVLSGYGLLFLAVELASRRFAVKPEVSRKVVHICAGLVAASLPLVITFRQIQILCLIFIPLMLLSKKLRLLSSIHNVKRVTLGEAYFPVGILIVATVFPNTAAYVFALLVLALGDGLAGVVGERYGVRKYHFGSSQKSYIGSATFFGVTTLVGWLVLLAAGELSVAAAAAVVAIAVILTALEAVLTAGLDNLVLPPIAGALLYALMQML